MVAQGKKIFGIGLPKTATTTLEQGFRDLGFNLVAFSRKDLNAFLKHGYCSEIRSTVDRHEAFSDWPWSLMYAELFSEFGTDAKYVLTRRKSAEVWLNSMKRHSMTTSTSEIRKLVYGVELPHGFEDHLVGIYNRHNREVRDLFRERNAEHALLELEIGSEGDWERFCSFLEVDPSGGRFGHANPSKGRTFDAAIVFDNLIRVNRAQRGLEKPALTAHEAMLQREAPRRRSANVSQTLIEHAEYGLQAAQVRLRPKWRTNTSGSLRGLVVRPLNKALGRFDRKALQATRRELAVNYTRVALDIIREHGLYGVGDPTPAGMMSGIEAQGDGAEAVLAKTIEVFLNQNGALPNLLVPQLFSEFLILYKLFGHMPTLSSEDKLENERFVPDRVRHLLTPHERPFVCEAPDVPNNEAVPPGSYYWKANHGWALHKKFAFPASESELKEMFELAEVWFQSEGNTRNGQWWNANVQKRVFLERDLGEGETEVDDWKFFVFSGNVEIVQVDRDRQTRHRQNIYDRDFNPLRDELFFERGDLTEKPDRFEEMVEIAEGIGEAFEFVRVDLYNRNGQIYLGELSVVPNSAWLPVRSYEIDMRMGQAWPSTGVLGKDLDWADGNARVRHIS